MNLPELRERHTEEPMISPSQLAARWGIKVSTLRQWRYKRRGPAFVKLGNTTRYRMTDVIDYENKGRLARQEH